MNEDNDDPFNNPESAHSRARELMTEEFFWHCADEEAPFGSDEGWDAFYEYRQWRKSNINSSLVECIKWILQGRLGEYNIDLTTDEKVREHIANPDAGGLGMYGDMFTLDATIMATVLGQLIDEGFIDPKAKPYARVAIARQSHPDVSSSQRISYMKSIARVVDEA